MQLASEYEKVDFGQAHSIMEYGSTPYIGMAPPKNGCPIVCVQSDVFKTLH